MSLLVHKYGGTSVGSVERIRAVAERVGASYRDGNDVVVVVSAMGGETNRLLSLGNSFCSLPSPREMDVLLSAGEQVSIALLSIALHSLDVPAKSYLADQIPIRTSNVHQKARIETIDPSVLMESLKRREVPVIAGFQGINEDGEITTIGRGGSDTSAVAIAAAIGASECLIYTDVDGVYTADPRIVQNATRMSEISFEEMMEMASLGANVLHTRSVDLAQKYEVPLRVLSSFEEGPGTLITKENPQMEKLRIRSVADDRDEAKITITHVPDVPGVAFDIFGPIGDANVVVDMIVQNVSEHGQTDISFTVKRDDYPKALEVVHNAIEEIAKRPGREEFGKSRIVGDNSIAKVSVIGIGMRSNAGVAKTMFEALAGKGINIKMISTSEIKISVVIDEESLPNAVQTLHDAFNLEEESE